MRRAPLTAILADVFVLLIWNVSVRQGVLFSVGVGMGATLSGTRFGFTTGWRRLVEERDPRGAMGQLLLLGLAATLAMPLLGTFPELHAALGPPSISLLVGAFFFGLTMQIADGCGSGTLYKAGLGVPLNMSILPIFALGSFLGSAHLNSWLSLGQTSPVSLVAELGTGKALILTWLMMGVTALAIRWWARNERPWLSRTWVYGAVLLAVLAALNLMIAGQPWGVVYGFGLWGAKVVNALGWFDPASNAFWSQVGKTQRLAQSVLMDVTSITNIGILGGALWISARAPTTRKALSARQWGVGMVAGLVMGYSSRLAFGCKIGALLSGISTASLHGWIWLPMAFLGTLIGLRVRRRFQF
ncbi:MAG: YeeE/YedE family protein [Burkholderiaceae bacterium]|nr:YeeE/YedE family protein [Burkholderiaceae bacterium]